MKRSNEQLDADQEFRYGKNAIWRYCDEVNAIENKMQNLKTNHRRQRIKNITEPA